MKKCERESVKTSRTPLAGIWPAIQHGDLTGIPARSQHWKKLGARPRRAGPFLTCTFARSATWRYVTHYTLKRDSATRL